MNADRLLTTLYDRVSEAPNAVDRLRRFVLELAVRGQLTQQSPDEEPASKLLKRVATQKARLIKAGEIKEKALHNQTTASIPFELPQNWEWTTLGEVFLYDAGIKRAPKELDSSFWLLELEDIEKETGRLIARVCAHARNSKSTKSEFQEGDILYGKLRPYLNKVVVADRAGYSTTEIVAIRPMVAMNATYCALALRRPDFVNYVTRCGQGTKMPRLRRDDAITAPFPLPPVDEQDRIAKKVDELMALCDGLAAKRNTREATRNQLTKASYVRLSAPDASDEAFRSHARFTLDALPEFTARADQIKQLRQAILDLAVCGKLVKQNPEDESASELLKRIAAQKAGLQKAGKIRKPRAVAPLNFDELPFSLPVGWEWTQIAHLGVINPRNDAPDVHTASFVPMPSIAAEYGVPHEHEPRPWGAIKKGYTHFQEGDVGLAKITPCFENGKSTVFRNLTGGFGSGTTELHVIRPLFVNADYIVAFLKSPRFIKTGIPRMTGTAGQKRVPTEYFTSSPFPLPPITEQQRIVEKIDSLMALCDRLEAGLSAINATHTDLLDSVLHEALQKTNLNQALN